MFEKVGFEDFCNFEFLEFRCVFRICENPISELFAFLECVEFPYVLCDSVVLQNVSNTEFLNTCARSHFRKWDFEIFCVYKLFELPCVCCSWQCYEFFRIHANLRSAEFLIVLRIRAIANFAVSNLAVSNNFDIAG